MASVDSAAGAMPAESGRLVPMVFTGHGGEYFRIWIVNLMLSIVTLGIYSAWAKVRRLQYFHRNTHVAGSAFDYHARPLAILIGRIVAVAALAAYSIASEFQPWSAGLLLLAYGLLLPWIIHRALKFRLQNTSWRGIRFGFSGTVAQAYRVLMLPVLALLAVLAGGLALAWALESRLVTALMAPVGAVGGYAMVPLLHYRLKAYHHGRARLGQLEGAFAARALQFYGVYVRTLLLALAIAVGASAILAAVLAAIGGTAALPAVTGFGAGPVPEVLAGLGLLAGAGFWLASSALGPYFRARLQNLVWNRTRVGPHRFVSRVSAFRLWTISVVNLVAIALTLGLFLPFAAIRVARYRVGAVHCAVLGDLDRIVAVERERVAALGEEAADLLDLDIGL